MRPHILSALALTGCALMISSCEDELSQIGSTMRPSDVTISVDSAAYDLKGVTIPAPEIEANSATSLLGSILSKYYGTLSCSYLTQFLPAENVNIPDSITPQDLDSVRMIMRNVPFQGALQVPRSGEPHCFLFSFWLSFVMLMNIQITSFVTLVYCSFSARLFPDYNGWAIYYNCRYPCAIQVSPIISIL